MADTLPTRAARFAKAFLRQERGNVLTVFAMVLPVFLGMTGLAFEGANWYRTKQSMQNAADAAVMAAATNNTSSYAAEAKAVAAQYGYVDGTGNTTVTATNAGTCPGGQTPCYSVTITSPASLVFAQLVGYKGDTTVSGKPAQLVSATAQAVQSVQPRSYCLVALASSGTSPGIRTNGAPFADLTGCSVMSNTDATCNGHNLKATFGDAHGTNSGCGISQTSKVSTLADPYAGLASNIPSGSCSSYPQAPSKKKDPDLPSSNLLSSATSFSNPQYLCGDVQLTSNITLTDDDQVIVIENGQLDTNGYTLKTASGAGATIIFTGDGSSGYKHGITGGGTLDIAAPTSGAWSGVAIYQDPDLTDGVDISAAGNSPTWNITGLVYLPHSSVTFSGAVNKSSNGQSCFVMVTDNVTINGTGSILSTGGCAAAGLTMPQGQVPGRGKLAS